MSFGKSALARKLNLSALEALENMDVDSADVMADTRYIRQSSTLVNDALQKGFDVLHLANGDIVTTGTKIIVTHYAWNPEKGKLVKTKSTSTMDGENQPLNLAGADVEAQSHTDDEMAD